MAALTDAYGLLALDSNAETNNIVIDGATVSEVFENAILAADASGGGTPLVGAVVCAGISRDPSTATTTRGQVITRQIMRGFAIAGAAAIGEWVYCATDNLADLTVAAGGATKIGSIIGLNKDGTTWDWIFDIALSAA